jgi:hypothetical protein
MEINEIFTIELQTIKGISRFEVSLEGIETFADFQCELCHRHEPDTKFRFKAITGDDVYFIGTSCIKKIKNNIIKIDKTK